MFGAPYHVLKLIATIWAFFIEIAQIARDGYSLYFNVLSLAMKMFKKTYIEISNICNLQCSFCPEVERGKQIMSKNEFEIILKKVLPYSEQVTLHLMGEPLAHPEFAEILNISERLGARLNITTNGIYLKRFKDLLLHSSALHQINFSVHSFKDNFPEKDVFPYLKGLTDFSQRLRETNPESYVNFRLWNLRDDLKHFQLNQDIIAFLEKEFEGVVNKNVDVSHRKSKKIVEKIYLHFDSQFKWPNINDEILGTVGTCYALSTQLAVHVDGTVVPCCLDKEANIALGNLLQQDLVDILGCAKTVAIKEGFSKGILVDDLCQKCSFIKRFAKQVPRLKESFS